MSDAQDQAEGFDEDETGTDPITSDQMTEDQLAERDELDDDGFDALTRELTGDDGITGGGAVVGADRMLSPEEAAMHVVDLDADG